MFIDNCVILLYICCSGDMRAVLEMCLKCLVYELEQRKQSNAEALQVLLSGPPTELLTMKYTVAIVNKLTSSAQSKLISMIDGLSVNARTFLVSLVISGTKAVTRKEMQRMYSTYLKEKHMPDDSDISSYLFELQNISVLVGGMHSFGGKRLMHENEKVTRGCVYLI